MSGRSDMRPDFASLDPRNVRGISTVLNCDVHVRAWIIPDRQNLLSREARAVDATSLMMGAIRATISRVLNRRCPTEMPRIDARWVVANDRSVCGLMLGRRWRTSYSYQNFTMSQHHFSINAQSSMTPNALCEGPNDALVGGTHDSSFEECKGLTVSGGSLERQRIAKSVVACVMNRAKSFSGTLLSAAVNGARTCSVWPRNQRVSVLAVPLVMHGAKPTRLGFFLAAFDDAFRHFSILASWFRMEASYLIRIKKPTLLNGRA